MTELTLFNKYHWKENTITNYCWLMLKLLYQSSPANFEKCIIDLIDEDVKIFVEPKFLQQFNITKKWNKTSIADLRIKQTEYELIFEVKTFDWFHNEQFKNYIDNLSSSEIKSNKILFALTDEYKDEEKYKNLSKDYDLKSKNITLQLITFSHLLESIKNNKVNEELFLRFLSEFEEFLDNNWLLNSWQNLLDVVNCAWTINQVNDWFYICPDTWWSYSHKRAKYFWPYSKKQVSSIFEIDWIVIINKELKELEVKIKYNNINNEKYLKEKTISLINKYIYEKENMKNKYSWEFTDFDIELEKYGLQVFILSKREEMKDWFNKSTPWWLFWNKKYFKWIAKNCKNSQELAEFLDWKNWNDNDIIELLDK